MTHRGRKIETISIKPILADKTGIIDLIAIIKGQNIVKPFKLIISSKGNRMRTAAKIIGSYIRRFETVALCPTGEALWLCCVAISIRELSG